MTIKCHNNGKIISIPFPHPNHVGFIKTGNEYVFSWMPPEPLKDLMATNLEITFFF